MRGCDRLRSSRKVASTVNQVNRVYRFCDRYAIERSLVLLVSGYEAG